MAVDWAVTFDCTQPGRLAEFWKLALGYVDAPVPKGFDSWEEWLRHFSVPEDEWDDGAHLVDPDGERPGLSFLKVPEGKVAKNRMHIDVKAGGGRSEPWDLRWPRVVVAVERLTAAGATVIQQYEVDGKPDHVVMADPEGNEFCLV